MRSVWKMPVGLLLGFGLAASVQAQEMNEQELVARMRSAIAPKPAAKSGRAPAANPRAATRSLTFENNVDTPEKVIPDPQEPAEEQVPAAPRRVWEEPGWGAVGSFHGIQFTSGSASLTTDSVPTLINIARAMKNGAFTDRVFLVVGHTDASGNPKANQLLSERRAASVVAFLQRQGVPRERLFPKGRGQTRPVNPSDAYADDNRRVEVMISLDPG